MVKKFTPFLEKKIFSLLFLVVFAANIFAQNTSKGGTRSTNQIIVTKIDESQNDNGDYNAGANIPAVGNENVSFSTTSEGIYINIASGTNKIKLFALTGQLLLNCDLSLGKYFIQTRKGIYFLKINIKSYKVICN